jgi:hypothetical protein
MKNRHSIIRYDRESSQPYQILWKIATASSLWVNASLQIKKSIIAFRIGSSYIKKPLHVKRKHYQIYKEGPFNKVKHRHMLGESIKSIYYCSIPLQQVRHCNPTPANIGRNIYLSPFSLLLSFSHDCCLSSQTTLKLSYPSLLFLKSSHFCQERASGGNICVVGGTAVTQGSI